MYRKIKQVSKKYNLFLWLLACVFVFWTSLQLISGATYYAALDLSSNGIKVSVSLWGKGISSGSDPRNPYIANITDVPNDQGKQVLIKWLRSNLDYVASDTVITRYGIWRRVDHLSDSGMSQPNDYKIESDINNDMAETNIRFVSDFNEMLNSVSLAKPGTIYILGSEDKSNSSLSKSTSCELWTFVGLSPAMQLEQYSIVAPTLFDSTRNDGIVWSAFFISAHTDNPRVSFMSDPDSGYSVDNLCPSIPSGFIATAGDSGVMMQWGANPEQDIDYYTIYRGLESNFNPSEKHIFTTETSYIDNSIELGKTYYYVVTSTDFSGNESLPSEEASILISRVANILMTPTKYTLEQNYPNPFNPETTIRYQLPIAGNVELVIFNSLGQNIRSLVNGYNSAGYHQVTWDGRDDREIKVSSGVYFYWLSAGDFMKIRKMVIMR